MNFKQLIEAFEQTHDYLQQNAVSVVNQSLTIRNWLFGFYIVEYEQGGEDRAKYAQGLLQSIAKKISRHIKGINDRYLRDCRQFYNTYPQIIKAIAKLELPGDIWGAVTPKLDKVKRRKADSIQPDLLISSLSFTHLLELSKEHEPLKRVFYEIHAIKGNWSIRELERQMGSLLFERTGLTKNKEKLLQLIQNEAVELVPNDIIRDPYVFEFLGLKQKEVLEEARLEQLLLDHLQEFLLELGKGFCFEARQKRVTIDNEHYYIDLLFYHRYLKCHVLIELKTRKFKHEDAGQMNFYLNYLKENEMKEGDNPPIGILLCTEKSQTLVKYATGGVDNKLFVSKYKLALPSEEELKAFIEKDKKMLS